jgi:hypothetical protein
MIEIIIKINGREIKWIVENLNVKSILEKLPKEKLPEYIEMYILVGDTVLSYASIQTSEETLQKYFGDIVKNLTENANSIAELRNRIDKEISENLPKTIKEKIELEMKEKLVELKGQIEALENINKNFPDTIKAQIGEYIGKLGEIANTLSEFAGRYKGAKGKGEIGEIVVYQTLVDNFKDDTFEDVSKQKNYSDIKASPKDGVDILIEIKNYKNNIPGEEVKKFWRDLDAHNINIGCFISLGTRIQGIGDYNIINEGNKLGIFINAAQFAGRNGMEDGIKLGYFIAQRFAEYYKKKEIEKVGEEELRKKINSVLDKMQYLKSKVGKLNDIRGELEKIENIAREQKKHIDSLYSEFNITIASIEKILSK